MVKMKSHEIGKTRTVYDLTSALCIRGIKTKNKENPTYHTCTTLSVDWGQQVEKTCKIA
jgi:hypothetical protein